MAYSVPYRRSLVSSKLLYSHVRDIGSVRASRCGSTKVSTSHIFPRRVIDRISNGACAALVRVESTLLTPEGRSMTY